MDVNALRGFAFEDLAYDSDIRDGHHFADMTGVILQDYFTHASGFRHYWEPKSYLTFNHFKRLGSLDLFHKVFGFSNLNKMVDIFLAYILIEALDEINEDNFLTNIGASSLDEDEAEEAAIGELIIESDEDISYLCLDAVSMFEFGYEDDSAGSADFDAFEDEGAEFDSILSDLTDESAAFSMSSYGGFLEFCNEYMFFSFLTKAKAGGRPLNDLIDYFEIESLGFGEYYLDEEAGAKEYYPKWFNYN